MRRKDISLKKVTLRLFDGDVEELRRIHPRVAPNKIIRALVRRYITDQNNKIVLALEEDSANDHDDTD